MTDKELKSAGKIFKQKAQTIVDRIAAERDKLRDLVQEYNEVLYSLDEANQAWDDVLDKMSTLL